MRTSSTWARQGRATVGILVLSVVFALVLGGLAVGLAHGQEPERRFGREERHEHWRERHRERRERGRERWEERGGPAYRPYGYYAPPPVVFAPPAPSLGLNLFFHIH